MIRGHSRKFDHAVVNITYDDTCLPMFIQAQTYLLREESRLTHLATHETATTLYTDRASSAPTPGPQLRPLRRLFPWRPARPQASQGRQLRCVPPRRAALARGPSAACHGAHTAL